VIVTHACRKFTVSLYALGPDRNPSTNTAEIPFAGIADELSFVGRDQGWLNLSGSLLATGRGKKLGRRDTRWPSVASASVPSSGACENRAEAGFRSS
jgi:hypothetical protein